MKKLLLSVLFCSLSFLIKPVQAQEDFTSIALEQQAKKQQTIAPYKAMAKAQEHMVKEKMQSLQFNEFKAFAMSQKNPLESQALDHQPVSDAVIFVSFSMPQKSLEQWLEVSRQLHVPLVLRGMVDNSIKKTESLIIPLVKKVHGGFQVNPVLFRAFKIQQVPAIVVINHNGCHTDAECGEAKQFDVIYGQTTMNYALSQLAAKGEEAPQVAEALLRTLPGEGHA